MKIRKIIISIPLLLLSIWIVNAEQCQNEIINSYNNEYTYNYEETQINDDTYIYLSNYGSSWYFIIDSKKSDELWDFTYKYIKEKNILYIVGQNHQSRMYELYKNWKKIQEFSKKITQAAFNKNWDISFYINDTHMSSMYYNWKMTTYKKGTYFYDIYLDEKWNLSYIKWNKPIMSKWNYEIVLHNSFKVGNKYDRLNILAFKNGKYFILWKIGKQYILIENTKETEIDPNLSYSKNSHDFPVDTVENFTFTRNAEHKDWYIIDSWDAYFFYNWEISDKFDTIYRRHFGKNDWYSIVKEITSKKTYIYENGEKVFPEIEVPENYKYIYIDKYNNTAWYYNLPNSREKTLVINGKQAEIINDATSVSTGNIDIVGSTDFRHISPNWDKYLYSKRDLYSNNNNRIIYHDKNGTIEIKWKIYDFSWGKDIIFRSLHNGKINLYINGKIEKYCEWCYIQSIGLTQNNPYYIYSKDWIKYIKIWNNTYNLPENSKIIKINDSEIFIANKVWLSKLVCNENSSKKILYDIVIGNGFQWRMLDWKIPSDNKTEITLTSITWEAITLDSYHLWNISSDYINIGYKKYKTSDYIVSIDQNWLIILKDKSTYNTDKKINTLLKNHNFDYLFKFFSKNESIIDMNIDKKNKFLYVIIKNKTNNKLYKMVYFLTSYNTSALYSPKNYILARAKLTKIKNGKKYIEKIDTLLEKNKSKLPIIQKNLKTVLNKKLSNKNRIIIEYMYQKVLYLENKN